MFHSTRRTRLTATAVRCPEAWVIEIPALRPQIGVARLEDVDEAVSRVVGRRRPEVPSVDLVCYLHLDDLTGHRRWTLNAASRRCVDGHPPESAA